MRWLRIFLLGIGVLGPLSCVEGLAEMPVAASSFRPTISAEDVRPHVEFLAGPDLKGRAGEDAHAAALYIQAAFKKLGLKPLFAESTSFLQSIPGKGDDDAPTIAGKNVGAWIPGSDADVCDEFIIISAHYDHLGIRNGQVFRGADDNATGVSMLLEVARRMAAAERKPRRSIAFVAFDLEEHLLWGSRWFVAHPPWPLEQVKLFITADMIGRSLGDLPLPTVFVLGSEHAVELKQALDEVGSPDGLEVARLGVDLIGTRSDYGPFWTERIPFLFFSTGEHPDYHSPRDVPERIDYDKVARVASLVLNVSLTVANARSTPVWIDETGTDLDEARALHRITTLLLEAGDEKSLTDLQRLTITQTKAMTKQILDRGQMTDADRTWLIRMSKLLLLSVF